MKFLPVKQLPNFNFCLEFSIFTLSLCTYTCISNKYYFFIKEKQVVILGQCQRDLLKWGDTILRISFIPENKYSAFWQWKGQTAHKYSLQQRILFVLFHFLITQNQLKDVTVKTNIYNTLIAQRCIIPRCSFLPHNMQKLLYTTWCVFKIWQHLQHKIRISWIISVWYSVAHFLL